MRNVSPGPVLALWVRSNLRPKPLFIISRTRGERGAGRALSDPTFLLLASPRGWYFTVLANVTRKIEGRIAIRALK
jgi:hypothetical protein